MKSNDTTLDVHLVSDAVLTTSGIASSMPLVEPRVTGRIFERTSGGEQPIPGARVVADFTGGDGWAPSATTMSDATGRFLICGADRSLGLGLLLIVSKAGYENAAVPVGLAPADSYDIELKASRTVE